MRQRRWRSRNPHQVSRRRVIFFVLLISLLFTLQSFIYIDKNLKPPLIDLAKVRLKQIATQTINNAINARIAEGTNFDKLVEWQTDKNGKISSFMLNYAEHMRITAEVTDTVQSEMARLKTMTERIPLGQAMGSPILASFGPDVPIHLVPEGSVKVDLNTRVQNAGINMILVEVYIHITEEVSIIIPFDSEPEVIDTELPISYMLVVGDTPMYYFDGKGNPVGNSSPLPPSVSLPSLGINNVSPVPSGASGNGNGNGAASTPSAAPASGHG